MELCLEIITPRWQLWPKAAPAPAKQQPPERSQKLTGQDYGRRQAILAKGDKTWFDFYKVIDMAG